MSSSVWGALADKSSRLTMAISALLAGVLGIVVVAALQFAPSATQSIAFYAVVLFVLNVAHAGVRIGRKTHVVDLAGGDRKAEYVALSNTIIGVLLLMTGALTGVLMGFGLEVAIAALAAMAILGALMALTMKHVQD